MEKETASFHEILSAPEISYDSALRASLVKGIFRNFDTPRIPSTDPLILCWASPCGKFLVLCDIHDDAPEVYTLYIAGLPYGRYTRAIIMNMLDLK